jgi:hypothetical protein
MKKTLLGLYILTSLMLSGINLLAQTAENEVDEKANKYELSAAPNPFENEVTITLNGGTKKLIAIRICDIIGSEVAFIDLRNKSGIVSYRLDFSALPSGVYFCNVYGEDGIIETKRLSHRK